MANGNPLAGGMVADISPLTNALERFTPQAREDRAFQLAGLEQQQQIGAEQLQQVQMANKKSQMLNIANEARTAFIEDRTDLDIVLKDGPSGMRNAIARMVKDKGEGHEDLPELIEFANKATQDPEGTFAELTNNRKNIVARLAQTNEVLGRLGGDRSSGQKERDQLLADLSSNDTKVAQSASIALGLSPRAVGSAAQTIADSGTSEQVGESEAIIKQRSKFGEMTGSSRAKLIDSGFQKIVKINSGIANLDRAISAIKSGAGTGALQRFLPSFKAASVELDQIQNQLALDVIGGVTLGAISAAELDLAKQVALPKGLDGDELIQHLEDRKIAQTKVRAYFQEQIDFLDQGGTVAGFLRKKRGEAAEDTEQTTADQTGQRLVFDPSTGQLVPK